MAMVDGLKYGFTTECKECPIQRQLYLAIWIMVNMSYVHLIMNRCLKLHSLLYWCWLCYNYTQEIVTRHN